MESGPPRLHPLRTLSFLLAVTVGGLVWSWTGRRDLSRALKRAESPPVARVVVQGFEDGETLHAAMSRRASWFARPSHPVERVWTLRGSNESLPLPEGVWTVRWRDRSIEVLLRSGDALTLRLAPPPDGYAYVPGGAGLAGMGMHLEVPIDDAGMPHDTDGFFLSLTEVSVGEYARFLARDEAADRDARGFGPFCSDEERTLSPKGCPGHRPIVEGRDVWETVLRKGSPDAPMSWASFFDALAFCRYLDDSEASGSPILRHRLPTRSEWERGARGVDGRPFPWGLEPKSPQARGILDPVLRVRSHPELRSPYGLFHCASGVSEWVLTKDGERRRVVMGETLDPITDRIHLAYRRGESPFARSERIGFRVYGEFRR